MAGYWLKYTFYFYFCETSSLLLTTVWMEGKYYHKHILKRQLWPGTSQSDLEAVSVYCEHGNDRPSSLEKKLWYI